MAYKEGHDVKQDIARLNQEYLSLDGVSCCTCSYCIKRQVEPTVSFSNFKEAGSIGFTEYKMPQGAFPELQYTLDFNAESSFEFYTNNSWQYYNIIYGYWNFSEPWDSPQVQSRPSFAKSLKYYNFRKCSGSPSSFFENYNSSSTSYYRFIIGSTYTSWIPTSGTRFPATPYLNNSYPYEASFVNPMTGVDNYFTQIGGLVTQYFLPNYWGYTGYQSAVFKAPVVSNGGIVSIEVVDSAEIFEYPPSIVVGDANPNPGPVLGNGFVGVGILSGKKLTSVSITNPGSGYVQGYVTVYVGSTLNNQDISGSYAAYLALSTCQSGLNSTQFASSILDQTNYVWYTPAALGEPFNTPACSVEDIEKEFGAGSSVQPEPPPAIDAGNYQALFDFMAGNDVSLSVKKNNSCSNTVEKVFEPLPAFNAVGHQYIAPDGYSKSLTHPVSGGLTGYEDALKEIMISGGYVLNRFDFNFLNGSFYIEFSIFFEKDFIATMYTCSPSDYITGPAYYGYINRSENIYFTDFCAYGINNISVWDYHPELSQFPFWWQQYRSPAVIRGTYDEIFRQTFYPTINTYNVEYTDGVKTGYSVNSSLRSTAFFRPDNLVFSSRYDSSTSISSSTDENGETTILIKNILMSSPTIGSAVFKNDEGDNRDVLANWNKVPEFITSYVAYGFYFDAEIKVQSEPLCKLTSIPDRLKRMDRFKVNFSEYKKIPQENNCIYDAAKEFKSQSPNDIGIGVAGYEFGTATWNGNNFYSEPIDYGIFYNNTIFIPPDTNQGATFYVNKYSQRIDIQYNPYVNRKNNIVEDVVDYEEGEFEYRYKIVYFNGNSTYRTFSRVYDSTQYEEDFAGCILIDAPPEVLQTGNEMKFYNGYLPKFLDPLPTNKLYYCIFVREITSNSQPAGRCLIKMAKTYQDAIDGKSIFIAGPYQNYYASFQVKYKYRKKDISLENAPRYLDFKTDNYEANNPELDALNVDYITNEVAFDFGEMRLNAVFSSAEKALPISFGFVQKDSPFLNYVISNDAGFLNYQIYGDQLGSYYGYDYVEYISLSPLKVKYKNVKFYLSTINFKYNYAFPFAFERQDVSGATAQAVVGNETSNRGAIIGFASLFGGSGYTSPPQVRVLNGDRGGMEGSFTAVLGTGSNSDKVVSITINDGGRNYYNPSVYIVGPAPQIPLVPTESTGRYGFMCDITIEEDIDEDQQHSLPPDYNQILEFKKSIITDSPFFKKPMEMINPEKCEHIGKVIDRKNCNCPKKWVRLCDIHEKTDWKKCMQCKDFKVSE